MNQSPNSQLKSRLNFHIAQKMDDEDNLMEYHQLLSDCAENQLCLASVHYDKKNFDESIDVYKRLILEEKEYNALH